MASHESLIRRLPEQPFYFPHTVAELEQRIARVVAQLVVPAYPHCKRL